MKFPNKNSHQIVPKGWGKEVHVHNDADYCCKLLHLNEGGQCSLHFHVNKVETFYILEGRVELELFHDLKSEFLTLEQGESIDIPRFLAHSFRGLSKSIILETSTFDEASDSVRIKAGDSQAPKQIPIDDDKFTEWEQKCNRINGK
tara:strand:- start:50 stop:487 length:438 start_codon:yes stop_codon:yes gene_type:complete